MSSSTLKRLCISLLVKNPPHSPYLLLFSAPRSLLPIYSPHFISLFKKTKKKKKLIHPSTYDIYIYIIPFSYLIKCWFTQPIYTLIIEHGFTNTVESVAYRMHVWILLPWRWISSIMMPLLPLMRTVSRWSVALAHTVAYYILCQSNEFICYPDQS